MLPSIARFSGGACTHVDYIDCANIYCIARFSGGACTHVDYTHYTLHSIDCSTSNNYFKGAGTHDDFLDCATIYG